MTKPDLNRLSAVEIMGWIDKSLCWVTPDTDVAITLVNAWSPLTDMNQCMMVVERMRELGWKYFRLEYPNEEDVEVYYCQFDRPHESQRNNWAESATINEAILTAALRAKGVLERK